MDRRAIYAVLILVAAGAGYWYYNKNKTASKAAEQPQDQTAATAAQQYYTQPPNIGVQGMTGGNVTYTNNGQAMPLPYNT